MVDGFAQAGADVVVVSRKADACEQVAKQLAADYGVETLPRAAHVGRWAELDGLVEDAYDRFGVGSTCSSTTPACHRLYDAVDSVSEELFDKVAVNLKGPFRLAALVGTRMAAGDGGSIINISSAVRCDRGRTSCRTPRPRRA